MSADVAVREETAETVASKIINLQFGFIRAIIADPSILDDIPNGVMLKLLPDDDPDLVEANIAIGLNAVGKGKDVYFRHVRVADFPPEPELTDEQRRPWLEHPEWDTAPDDNAASPHSR
jgi:hypothetical protein